MLGIVKVVNGVKTIQTLAGASGGGLPVGSILAIHSNMVPAGYLPCNGTTYDISQYPSLYTILGTNVLPDLRECNLVGIGTRGSGVTTHDPYNLGEFKDDQVQNLTYESTASSTVTVTDPGHSHPVYTIPITPGGSVSAFIDQNISGASESEVSEAETGISVDVDTQVSTTASGRLGTTTHGKNYGINYVIKAVTGLVELDDAAVLAQVVSLLETAYVPKNLNTVDSDFQLIYYNSTTNKWEGIDTPTSAKQTLKPTFSGNTQTGYEWGNASVIEYVQTLPTNPNIEDIVYGIQGAFEYEYYMGNSSDQSLTALRSASIVHTSTAPVSPNILDIFYNVNGVLYYGNRSLQTITPVLTDEPVLTN